MNNISQLSLFLNRCFNYKFIYRFRLARTFYRYKKQTHASKFSASYMRLRIRVVQTCILPIVQQDIDDVDAYSSEEVTAAEMEGHEHNKIFVACIYPCAV